MLGVGKLIHHRFSDVPEGSERGSYTVYVEGECPCASYLSMMLFISARFAFLLTVELNTFFWPARFSPHAFLVDNVIAPRRVCEFLVSRAP